MTFSKFTLLIILIFCSKISIAQNYLLMHPADCANCLSAIYDLNKSFPETEFKLIYPEQFKDNRADINEQLGLDDLKNMKLFFSDDVLKKYHTTNGSSLVIIYNGSIKYNQEFKNINKNDINSALTQIIGSKGSFRKLKIDSTAIPKNGMAYTFINKYLLVTDYFGKTYVLNILNNQSQKIIIDKSIQINLYKILLKNTFGLKYPLINETIKKMPIHKPKINKIRVNDEGEIYLQITVLNYFIKQKSNGDTAFFHDNIIAKYDFDKGKIISLSSIDNKQLLPMYCMDIILLENGVIAAHVKNMEYPDNSILYLMRNENNVLRLANKTNVKKTKEFITYSINVMEPLIHHKGYVIGRYDNMLYNINDGTSTKLVLPDSIRKDIRHLETSIYYTGGVNNKYSYYQNQSLSLDRNGNPVLYFYYNNQRFLYHTKTKKLIEIPERMNRMCTTDGKMPLGFYKDAHTLVWFDRNTKELVFYEHGLLD